MFSAGDPAVVVPAVGGLAATRPSAAASPGGARAQERGHECAVRIRSKPYKQQPRDSTVSFVVVSWVTGAVRPTPNEPRPFVQIDRIAKLQTNVGSCDLATPGSPVRHTQGSCFYASLLGYVGHGACCAPFAVLAAVLALARCLLPVSCRLILFEIKKDEEWIQTRSGNGALLSCLSLCPG